jgi:hypothetical protein
MFSSLCHAQQQKKQDFFLSEYNVSVNHSIYNFGVNTFGYGAGGYRSFPLNSHFHILTGITYNYSKQVQAYDFAGSHSGTPVNNCDFTISMNSIAIPVNLRFTYGSKTTIFSDAGLFVESIINSQKQDCVFPTNSTSIQTFSKGEDIRTLNFGGNAAIGLSRKFGANRYYLKSELHYGVFNNRYLKLCLGVCLG